MASPLEMTEMYDNALLGILQHVGNVQDFLQVYFGFLYRKTDFYRLLTRPDDHIGFPAGVAERMVLKTFKCFERMADQDRERRLKEVQQRGEAATAPPPVQELEIKSEPQDGSVLQQQQQQQQQNTEGAAVDSCPSGVAESTDSAASGPHPPGSGPAPLPQSGAAEAAGGNSAKASQEQRQADPDSYNGAVRENYSWSQDYSDVEVRVFVPKTVVKGRQVFVSLQTNSVHVCLREGGEEKVLMTGELMHKINTENSLWSLEPGLCVVLSLNKCGEIWWNAVLKGEEQIDINQINRERSMATVDDEEHAVLDRLTFDYHQKLQGKPQSHEMKVHEMLKKGWDAEGSPFRGQQFDPSMFDIQPSAVQF